MTGGASESIRCRRCHSGMTGFENDSCKIDFGVDSLVGFTNLAWYSGVEVEMEGFKLSFSLCFWFF